jgi:hypothetical protein
MGVLDKLISAGGSKAAGALESALAREAPSVLESAAARAVGPEIGPAAATKLRPTVKNAQRMAYPGIYSDPRELVGEAAKRVAPEDPILKQLFGVTRDDLYQIGEQGMRKGNLKESPFPIPAKSRGAQSVEGITTPKNTQRMQDIIGEAMQHPELHDPMASWYVMDPLYQHFVKVFGPEQAAKEYKQFNALTGMASPGSEVLTELNRGTGANWLAHEGRFDDFLKYAGRADHQRGANFPDDIRGIMGHAYHSTAQVPAMAKYLNKGEVDMGSAKVPSYIQASGVPETGFQSDFPVADAHFSRIIGLADTRNPQFAKGEEVVPKASASTTETASLTPWWQDIAASTGLSPVGAQGVVWGAGSGATGVTSPIGAPKLELLAQQIHKAAKRMGVSPETARDMIIAGKAHAGVADPELLGATAAGAGALAYAFGDEDEPPKP